MGNVREGDEKPAVTSFPDAHITLSNSGLKEKDRDTSLLKIKQLIHHRT